MKLTEIKAISNSGYVDLMEGVIPPHLTMTLEQVVKAGKITNNVQTFIMADLVTMLKNGGPTRWPRELNPYPMNAGAEMIESIRSLSGEEAADLAAWLIEELQKPSTWETNPCPCYNPQMGTVEWIRWVLKKQD